MTTLHPASSIQHPTPNIQHPASNTQHPTPNIQRRGQNGRRRGEHSVEHSDGSFNGRYESSSEEQEGEEGEKGEGEEGEGEEEEDAEEEGEEGEGRDWFDTGIIQRVRIETNGRGGETSYDVSTDSGSSLRRVRAEDITVRTSEDDNDTIAAHVSFKRVVREREAAEERLVAEAAKARAEAASPTLQAAVYVQAKLVSLRFRQPGEGEEGEEGEECKFVRYAV